MACSKSNSATHNEGLTGKWELTEYFISPGDAGNWYPADNSTVHTIEFRSDRSFTCSNTAYNGAVAYEMIDSNKIKLIEPSQIPAEIECYFTLQDDNQTLILSPMGCIEGCSNKYKAIKNSN